MPISFFEGVRPAERDHLSRRNMERRFYALAAAVKGHEAARRREGTVADTGDERLYRALREICGETTTAENRAV